MKIAKIIAGAAAGISFLLMLGAVGSLDFASEAHMVLSPDEVMSAYAKACADLLIFAFSMSFLAIAERFESWKEEHDKWRKSWEERHNYN